MKQEHARGEAKNRWTVPPELRDQFRTSLLETNISRMLSLSIYIIAIQILLNVINIVKPSEGESENIMIYIVLSMATLLMGIVYFVLLLLAKRGRIRSPFAKRLLIHSLLYLYIIIQMIFCTLNVIATGGINSYIIALLIMGLFPILSPKQSVPTALLAFGYLLFAMYQMRDTTDAWSTIFATDTWTNLIIITGMIMVISVFIYQMYVSNFLKEVALQESNLGLEELVHARTLELEEQTREAQVASRAKSVFLGRMSHEIRTPLNAIIGMTRIAQQSAEVKKVKDSLEEIDTASLHLLDMLNDILDMANIETGNLRLEKAPFDLTESMLEVRELTAKIAQSKGISFVCELPEGSIGILGDRRRLKQVLLNLLDNALKFTPVDGTVSLRVTTVQDEERTCSIYFEVKDSGVGMSQEFVERLFVPFEQGDEQIALEFGGSGLGLPIGQHIARAYGSEILVESKPGEGSKFSFTASFEKASLLNEQIEVAPNLRGKHILIAEDVQLNRVILQELLAETGAEVFEAEDGALALEAFKASSEGYYDFIFMDIQMPNMNGYETAQAIRALPRADAGKVIIIATTAYAYRADIEAAMFAGMNEHIAKPVDVQKIWSVLQKYE